MALDRNLAIRHLSSMTDRIDIERFARHIVLREIGGPGQQALSKARIAIVGAGGLGAPAALYLAAAGIGRITLIDPDTVSLDNLQRQILFRTGDVGRAKVEAGAETLAALHPGTQIDAVASALDASNANTLLAGADLVLDGCDNFQTRFAVNAGQPGGWAFRSSRARWAAGTDRSPCSTRRRTRPAIAAGCRTSRRMPRPAPAWALSAPWSASSVRPWPWKRSSMSAVPARRSTAASGCSTDWGWKAGR